MKPLDRIIETARKAPRHIVLSEGEDPRIVAGAVRARRECLAEITLVGNREVVMHRLAALDANPREFRVEDPSSSSLTDGFAASFLDLRRSKGVDEAAARVAVLTPLNFAAMMVREGLADGTVGGAIATTADTVRAALQVIGRAPGVGLVSSFFLMMLCEPHHARKGAFVFADCGLVVDPDAGGLADIALMSAKSYEQLAGERAKVAMLSFSTGGSAAHERVSKVVEATRMARCAEPDLVIDGELQFDSAFVEAVSLTKAPQSALRGEANVFVFPNLDAANIGYKIAQRIGGATAIGPILQGLARPANDLSRGCSADDVFHMIAVTVVQGREDNSTVSERRQNVT
ncbi:phosphate acetyltransferase [Sinorhizobium medicae]|uniref:phosphate acetyltransferase n=1 Tax=Sinorhizobium medicae TaxID=110321 RepID=UPI000FDA864B|nr:phosphate acetyltransferase [Sinorhizobium medicae]MDX0434080.1 phosphate acetyltransferase [Sinorhizobium medicae]MDX0612334.1 phosphate acetyltransferase [Sinorhizobium medicae]MDX0652835.1 phosphate acetyltransferase [Sinorhizobium medicae]MDX0703635.1 phosphate acetyltransferase [Sinorhizobium medicae]MDX0808801.1 phosphate acetyltransferase [Sinorhizobium medicae]